MKQLADNDLAPKLAPIVTQLKGARLTRAAQGPIASPIPMNPLERLRIEHLATAERLCASVQTENLGMAFTMRLVAVRDALRSPIDEASGLTLGVQAQGLRRMLVAIHEEMSLSTATDVDVFVGDVLKIANQFPDYTQFTVDASRSGRHTAEQRAALVHASKFFENQPDDLVAPEVKVRLTAVRVNAEDRPDEISDLAFERTIGNILKTYGNFFVERLQGIRSNTWQTFDKASGGTIGAILAILLIGLPVLALLQTALPGPFAFLVSMMKLVKTIIP